MGGVRRGAGWGGRDRGKREKKEEEKEKERKRGKEMGVWGGAGPPFPLVFDL